ncbi:DUF4179 domain-containing protein [Clostridium aminobutyricum]|uniref:DUF4179 domain-containing protein n=1 Tax=Clostridium aminobutyricum TaxID=33953 RepID=A0A939D994_CLOAM|nr:DUF4179 domain-containing protein [Clostridium aminobutyricum]MBN7773108.1 DUF4179 domain-containing protein [Clostridium aminobutyricum]
MMNSWKSDIDDRLNEINISPEVSQKILDATVYRQKKDRGRVCLRKGLAVAFAMCVFIVGSITAFAATVPAVNDWIYTLSPTLAERLYPIHQTVEDKGIKLDVMVAVNDSHNALVYFSVQDKTGKRVDESTDIYNYSLEGPFAFNCQMLSYDEKSHTAVFQLMGTGGVNMSNKMTTLAISSFLSNKIEHAWYDTQINLADAVDRNAASEPVSNYYYSGGSGKAEDLYVLTPDQMQIALGERIDFVTVSNIGFVDGKLHIQTKWNESVDDHGQLKLVDANGNEVEVNNYYFNTDLDTQNGDRHSKHIEYVFDIADIDHLKNYHLWASFTEDGDYTQGSWNVNFRLADSENVVIDSKKEIADTIEISTLGIYFTGYRVKTEETAVVVTMKDGEQLSCRGWNTSVEEDESGSVQTNAGALFEHPVELKEIQSISLNGTLIYNHPII